jgi:molybdopterin-guanine dinucleotide biosynthesis protein A
MLARSVQTLATLTDDLIVVSNEPASLGSLGLPVRIVPDDRPGEGSLMGIYSGLKVARYAYALVAACDMPFLNLPLIRYMLPLAEGYDVVIPRLLNGMLEPLHAIYGKTCLPLMSRSLEQGLRQIIGFFPHVRVRYVEENEIDVFDPLHLSFLNVNSPADWDRAQLLLQQDEPSASTRSSSPR